MDQGIWVSPDSFISFEALGSKKELFEEIASRQTAWDWMGDLGLLPDPDPILRKLGEGDAVLEALMADDQVCSVIQTRKVGTLNKEHSWEAGTLPDQEPTSEATRLRDNLVEDLKEINMRDLISGLLDAPYFGMAPVEIKWAPGDNRIKIKDLEVKPTRWFGFTEDNKPRFVSINNPWDGESIPYGKFVFSRHFPTYDNPYGLRLLSRCLWPVAFKKGGIKFWVTLAEKYGMPFLVGKYRSGMKDGEKQNFLSALNKMVRDAVALIPDSGSVEIMETGKGSKSAEIHSGLVNAMNAAISKIVMGQTLTAEVGDTGSYAASKTHENVLEDYRESDQKLVQSAMEGIARIYAAVNAPGVEAPTFKWFEEEEIKKERAERDKHLREGGVHIKKAYYVRTYGFKDDEIEVVAPATKTPETKPATPAKPDPEFAEADSTDAIDDLVNDMLDDWEEQTEPILQPIIDAVESADSFEDLQQKLQTLFEKQNSDELIAALATGLFKARALGDAGDEA